MIIDLAKATRVEDEVARRGGLDLKRFGTELVGPCPQCGGRDRFAVSVRKQVFLCRGCGRSGDVIAMVQHLDACTFPEAIRTLIGAERKPAAPVAKPTDSIEKLDEHNAKLALRLWDDASEIRGTIAEAYLARRGLEPPDGDDVLRYFGGCPFDGSRYPCLLSRYRNISTNRPQAIGRVALGPNGIKIGRLTLGPTKGAAVKVDCDENIEHTLVIGEGLETTLAARQLGFSPVWSLGSSGAIKNFPVLSGITSLSIITDNDAPDRNGRRAGQEAAAECSKRWTLAGREVRRVVPKTMGADMADLIGGNGDGKPE
jgi:phage/plasmid primase-like uncharacterized protein